MAHQKNYAAGLVLIRTASIVCMAVVCIVLSLADETLAQVSLDQNEEIVYRSYKGTTNIDVGLGMWMSQGRSNWNHDASSLNSLFGNPTSALDYKDVWSNIVELNARLFYKKGFSLKGQIGYGAITEGTLIDDDFVSASGATFYGTSVNGPHRFSRTESDIGDSYVIYVNGDVGFLFYPFSGNKRFSECCSWVSILERKICGAECEAT